MTDTECFASTYGLGCSILIDTDCKDCSFRKTKEEYNESARNMYKRLRSLPEEIQSYIARKYYRNKKLWGDD